MHKNMCVMSPKEAGSTAGAHGAVIDMDEQRVKKEEGRGVEAVSPLAARGAHSKLPDAADTPQIRMRMKTFLHPVRHII